jgi:hypothetical protein
MLAAVAVPDTWQAHYDPYVDSTVLLEPQRNQVVLFGWIDMEPRVAVRALLAELGGTAYSDAVQHARIRGHEGAEVRIDSGSQTKDWVLAVRRGDAILGVWAKTVASFSELEPLLSEIVARTEIAEATWPDRVAGRYQISSTYSGGVGGSLLSEEYVRLHADGTVVADSAIMGGTEGVSALGQSTTGTARWEVRGDRLLIITRDGELISRRLEGIYNNGLSFYGESQGADLEHWVRQ